MMRGDVGGALSALAGAGALTADFVSMAAAGGRAVWAAAARALAAQLEIQGAALPPTVAAVLHSFQHCPAVHHCPSKVIAHHRPPHGHGDGRCAAAPWKRGRRARE